MTQDRRTHTRREIDQQPDVWTDAAPGLAAEAAALRGWIAARAPEAVWLCGAGSSAFVGEALARGHHGDGPRLEARATTDLVADPRQLLAAPRRLLVLQFGRSGDSSESVGLLDLLDALRPDADRLHITCNPDGALARRAGPGPGETRALVLPEATHDRGFAMTSSFTTMLLAALATLDPRVDAATALPALAASARGLLPRLWAAAPPRPERAIFLGSAGLTAIARESALKVLELTAGATITAWDSSLGFRHGPKAAVDAGTAVYVLVHPDPQIARYDRDLLAELRAQYPAARVVSVGAGCDIALDLTGSAADAALFVLPAQVLAHQWSEALGLPVDDPFAGRGLTRVVAGVTLYGFAP